MRLPWQELISRTSTEHGRPQCAIDLALKSLVSSFHGQKQSRPLLSTFAS